MKINIWSQLISYLSKLIINFLSHVQFFSNPYLSNEEIYLRKMNGINSRQIGKTISDSIIKQIKTEGKYEEINGERNHKTSDGIPKKAVSPIKTMNGLNKDLEIVNGDEFIDDPYCRPEEPHIVSFADVTSAAFKIRNGIIETPCQKSQLSEITGMEIYFKKDFLQSTGSFKERGACYSLLMLPDESKKSGVITASLGNHALALCYHGKRLKIPVTVIMPILAPIMKVEACKKLDANVIVAGSDMKESKYLAMKMGKEKGLTYINGYDHPHIIAGQGTLGLEIVEQVQNIDAVIVPVGGGGLIAGVALAVKTLHPNVKIIGVESERCPSFTKARKAGKPIPVPISSTLADGLAVPMVGYNAFATALPLVDEVIVLKEEWIAIAILRLIELEKCVVEGAGATGLAAILAGHLNQFKGKRVVIPLCGGNIDTTILGRCIDRGLAADGRLLKFSIMISDRPGGISELCKLLADMGVSIKDILHERAWITSDVFSVKVKVVCETRDMDHTNQLKALLNKTYKAVSFGDIPNFPLLGNEFDELDM